MAANDIIWGFGGVKFVQTYEGVTTSVTFDDAFGNMIWEPVRKEFINISDEIKTRIVGWRLHIYVKNIFAINSNEFENMQKLMYMLSRLYRLTTQNQIQVYPKLDDSLDNNINYGCILSGDVRLEDIHATKIGQKINLEFIDPRLYSSIQDLDTYSGADATIYWDNGSEYEDEDGNLYQDDND